MPLTQRPSNSPQRSAPTAGRGYASPEYAGALIDIGRPHRLGASGASLLVRRIPGGLDEDACGPYPLLVAPNPSGLRDDLDGLAEASASGRGGPVSVVAVLTPFCGLTERELRLAFPHLARPFKEHFVVALSAKRSPRASRHHERNVRRALGAVEVEALAEPRRHLDEWCALYDRLRARRGIAGPAAFSRESFARQLAVPGLTAFRARAGEDTVAMTLWFESHAVGYYHLGASNEAGYALRASFALFAAAIGHFRSRLDWLDLGAGAGLEDVDDGLTRFKRGWATGTRTAWLCGRILDAERYEELRARFPGDGAFFPAYRCPGR